MRYFKGWKAVAALAGCCAVGLAVVFTVRALRPPTTIQKFAKAYKAIQEGMTEDEVQAILKTFRTYRDTHQPITKSNRLEKLAGEAVVTIVCPYIDPLHPESAEGLFMYVYLDVYGKVVGKEVVEWCF